MLELHFLLYHNTLLSSFFICWVSLLSRSFFCIWVIIIACWLLSRAGVPGGIEPAPALQQASTLTPEMRRTLPCQTLFLSYCTPLPNPELRRTLPEQCRTFLSYAVFGSYLWLSSLYSTNTVSSVRACLIIWWESFRWTQKEDGRGRIQSSYFGPFALS